MIVVRAADFYELIRGENTGRLNMSVIKFKGESIKFMVSSFYNCRNYERLKISSIFGHTLMNVCIHV